MIVSSHTHTHTHILYLYIYIYGVRNNGWNMRTCICVSYSGDSHSAESHQGLQGNYCRNPDSDKHGAWCYTDPNTQLVWDYCRVKHCECFWRSSIGAQFAHYSRFRPLFFVFSEIIYLLCHELSPPASRPFFHASLVGSRCWQVFFPFHLLLQVSISLLFFRCTAVLCLCPSCQMFYVIPQAGVNACRPPCLRSKWRHLSFRAEF